jgi:hypothetical protein
MRTFPFQHLYSATLPLAIAAVIIGSGCGDAATDAHDATSTSANGTVGQPADGNGTSTLGSADARTGGTAMDANEIRINGATAGTPVYDERYAASKDVRSYRALLMAELEAIRTRLNDGTRPADAAKQDQDRAADLAQGLERMDRLIKAVEESDDITWTSIRESSLKEAGEVRTWADEHGYKVKS